MLTEFTEDSTGDSSNNSSSGNPEGFEYGNGNGEVPPGQNVDEDGNIVNNGGNIPPGLNRRDKTDKEENPNPPETPENPGTEDSDDAQVNSAGKGTHIYTYDELNRMATSDISKVESSYTYDTLGNLIYEKEKNVKTDYQYNELNQLVSRKQDNESYTYSYDKRGNRIAEAGRKETREYIYDETNHLVEGTNWKGDKSAYTYNGLDVRINNTQTAHSGSVYSRDYVIDYTSLERDDLMVFAGGDGQLDYVQREVYAGSERIEQFTDRSNSGYERLLYVHEDLMGNTRYYTKANGQSYAELTYDAWGMPESPNKLLNNDHGNYVYATYTGHIFDTTLDIYFAEARFYDANTRTWLAMDPIKDGGNWYQYCYSNPLKYWDPLGLFGFSTYGCTDVNNLITQIHKGFVDIRESVVEFINRDDVQRILTGLGNILNGGLAAGVGALAVITALAAFGTTAAPAIMIATLVSGTISLAFGASDLFEGIQQVYNAIANNDKVACNLIRDNIPLFRDNPKIYYAVEQIAMIVASMGTASLQKPIKTASLVDELSQKDVKFNPDDIVDITKTSDGKIVWLEKGNSKAGLEHIMKHVDDFANQGISEKEIADYVMTAIEHGNVVGYQGKGTGRPIFEFMYKGQLRRVAVTVGNNGFVVGANPVSIK